MTTERSVAELSDPQRRQAVGGEVIHLMLRMRPPWVFIDEIRRFTESFCACACPGANREAGMALAVHELMQNAITTSRGEDIDLVFEVEPRADRVSVSITNRCASEEFETLRDRIERMNREPDALAHYLEVMRETPSKDRGGLGLARVRFEAQLSLSAAWVGGRVTVRAEGRIRVPALHAIGGTHV